MVGNIKFKFQVNTKDADTSIRSDIRSLLTEVKKDFNAKYYSELKLRLLSRSTHNYFFSKTLQVLADMQSEYFGSGLIAHEDPTAFLNGDHVRAVEKEIIENFTVAAETLRPGQELNLTLLSDDFLGFGREGDTTGSNSIQWLAYFLSGALDTDLYWVDANTYEIFTGASPGGHLGRFGVGHLWQISSEESKKLLNSKLKPFGKTLDQLRHPQSGKIGKNWFADVLTQLELDAILIQPAINETIDFIQAKYANYRS